ncbi:MAG TPA: amidase [Acidobacteria bacterium]|nr:amidase [Acidobacteriota bacterium]
MAGHDRVKVGRRDFLRVSALTVGATACGSVDEERPGETAALVRETSSDFQLEETAIADLTASMRSGDRTTRSIVSQYLSRIQQLDRQGPMLQSVIETNPEALNISEELDREREAGTVRSPLHGVPVLLKDNIDTADQMTTTAGSLALQGSIPLGDSTVARRLREAGAVLLGKANLSEWANYRSTRSSSGWSARGGQCRNPYALDRSPCGSSSGSGVAVSANLVTVAIGTETDGSIVCPASTNGIVGIKPTVGLVSRSGIVPISATQDTAGPMARTVRDAVVVLGLIAGVDTRDPATEVAGTLGLDDYTPFLDEAGLTGARIGVQRSAFGFHPLVDRLMEDAIVLMRDRGATIVDPIALRPSPTMRRAEVEVMAYEFKTGLNAYLAALPNGEIRSLADLIAFNEAHAGEEMPYFGQERLVEAQRRGSLSEDRYQEAHAVARRLSREEGIDRAMDADTLDAVIAPTGGPAWVIDHVNGDHFSGGSSSLPAVAGYPNITVPAGYVQGLPVGLSFFGRAWSEPTLIRTAYAFEQASRHRQQPAFLPTLGADRA